MFVNLACTLQDRNFFASSVCPLVGKAGLGLWSLPWQRGQCLPSDGGAGYWSPLVGRALWDVSGGCCAQEILK